MQESTIVNSAVIALEKRPSTPVPLHARSCPICGSDGDKVFAEAHVDFDALDAFAYASRKTPEYMHWRLVLCRACDLLYAGPAPSPEDLASLYRDADFGSSQEAGHAARTYGQLLPEVVAHLPELDGAVDIGAGEGAFLKELLACGFKRVLGLEPSAAAIAAADPAIRPCLQQAVFEPNLLPSASLNLVTCFQTIEHVSAPLDLCREAYQLLRPGGALMLVGHNRRALSAKVLGRKSPIFDIEHLQLFSQRSLQRLLEQSGFSRISVRPLINRYPARYWLRLLPLGPRAKNAALRLLDATTLGQRIIPLPAGNLVALGYK
jgi:SAM-dependent methyltransferase